MFSSLASLIFGSNQTATQSSEPNKNTQLSRISSECVQALDHCESDSENTIDVTSSTPSIAGANSNSVEPKGKHSKNKRNKNNIKIKEQKTDSLSITKLFIPNKDIDQELDEDDWFIVSKEDEGRSSANTDSEDEISVIGIKSPSVESPRESQRNGYPRPRRFNGNSNSFSGPRPQQYRNYLHRTRNSGDRVSSISVSTITTNGYTEAGSLDSGVTTQSLCVLSSSVEDRSDKENNSTENGFQSLMDESWFVTPPPCFTSIGPINMESSPFENLLIEHPSMSVYHSIKLTQDAVESFVNLDLGVKESRKHCDSVEDACSEQGKKLTVKIGKKNQSIVQKPRDERLDRHSFSQMKAEELARNNQKNYDKMKCQNIRRGAIKRANKVREFQSKGNRQRRADMQHCKVISGVNNNRKSCF